MQVAHDWMAADRDAAARKQLMYARRKDAPRRAKRRREYPPDNPMNDIARGDEQ